jgi:hypothetical protein
VLNDRAKKILKKRAGVIEDVDFQINRKSKWIVEVSLIKGLVLYAKFKFHCKNGTMERVI